MRPRGLWLLPGFGGLDLFVSRLMGGLDSMMDTGMRCADTRRMKLTLGSMIGFALCALMLSACDANAVPGFGGGVVCASDDSSAGNVYECPGGDKTFDFCINTSNGSCYYVVDGDQLNCGNCLEGNTINECAAQAAESCDQ